MYKIPQPAMACNADNLVGFSDYRMWNTRTVSKDVKPAWLASNIASVARSAEEGRLRAVVLNAHGYPGRLGLGTGIGAEDAPAFAALKSLVGEIYIVGCGIAGFRKSQDGSRYLDGPAFCSALARHSGAPVYAPKSGQKQSKEERTDGIPFGYIDDMEGEAQVFFPDGSVMGWNKLCPVAKKIF